MFVGVVTLHGLFVVHGFNVGSPHGQGRPSCRPWVRRRVGKADPPAGHGFNSFNVIRIVYKGEVWGGGPPPPIFLYFFCSTKKTCTFFKI